VCSGNTHLKHGQEPMGMNHTDCPVSGESWESTKNVLFSVIYQSCIRDKIIHFIFRKVFGARAFQKALART